MLPEGGKFALFSSGRFLEKDPILQRNGRCLLCKKKATPFQSLEAVSALAFASHWIEAVPGFDQLAALHCPSPTFTEKHRDFPVRLGGITAF